MAPLDEYTTNNYLTQNGITSDYLRQLSGMFNPPPADQTQIQVPASQPIAPSGPLPAESLPTTSFLPEEPAMDGYTSPEYDFSSDIQQPAEADLMALIEQIAPSLMSGSGELSEPTQMPTPTPNQKNKLLASAFVGGDFRISQEYGANKNSPLYRKLGGHEGVDIATPIGTEVRVPFNGVIEVVGDRKSTPNMSNYGNWVRVRDIDTGNTYDLAHLSSINVKPGKTIKAGEVIGKTGNTGKSTGPHLHISEWQNGKRVNPMGQGGGVDQVKGREGGGLQTVKNWGMGLLDTLAGKTPAMQKLQSYQAEPPTNYTALSAISPLETIADALISKDRGNFGDAIQRGGDIPGALASRGIPNQYAMPLGVMLSMALPGAGEMSQMKAKGVGKDIFTKKTGMSSYDALLNEKPLEKDPTWTIKEYYAKEKGRVGEVVYMSPDEYLSKIAPAGPTESSLKFFREKVAKGEKLEMPSLDYGEMMPNEMYPSQEGRNRAYFAKELGIEEIPVLVVNTIPKTHYGGIPLKPEPKR